MMRRILSITAVAVLLISGCGSVSDPAALVDTPDDVEVTGTEAGAEQGDEVLREQGFPDTCPEVSDTFNMMNEGAYQVFGQIDQFNQQTGEPDSYHFFIGTAWAVGDHLLATNAHITEAFVETAEQGTQLSRAIAVQSGTGKVVRLLRALTHPDYTGDPLRSPDVGLLTTQESLPTILPLAADDSVVDLGGEFQLVGFPGDVEDFIAVTPGVTVPQATSLTGNVTARRSHDDTQQVTLDTLDVYQHQAPTTPGTSGSSIAHCGLVFAINNAGTVQMVVTPTETGEYNIDRTSAASNNFAVHVRYIHQMVDLFNVNALQGFELPVPAVIQQPAPGNVPGGQPGEVPGGQPGEVPGGQPGEVPGGQPGEQPGGQAQGTIYFEGLADTPEPHNFQFMVDLATGEIGGVSDWGNVQLQLFGNADVNTGEFMIWDNAADTSPDLTPGYYFGYAYQNGTFEGYYAVDETTMYPIQGMQVG